MKYYSHQINRKIIKNLSAASVFFLSAYFSQSVQAEYQTVKMSEAGNQIRLISANDSGCTIEVQLGNYQSKKINIDGVDYNLLDLPMGSLIQKKGYPELPKISKSIIIPQGKGVSCKIVEQNYKSYKMNVAPSKGTLMRTVDPQSVEYVFNQIYQDDKYYPENLVEVGEPYLIREVRGARINVFPFSYNPVTGSLRVYTKLKIEIKFNGQNMTNSIENARLKSNKFFEPILKNHFLNYSQVMSTQRLVADSGKMLVIAHNDFMDEMLPFVQYKNSIGLTTELVSMNTVGTTATDVDSFIQNYYDHDNALAFVLLVGDNAQIPTLMVSGGGSDPSYSLVSGNDNYPDIILGRFSAETSDQVNTMVQRSINYNKNDSTFNNGIAIASSQGTGDDGEFDWEHERNIRTDLLNWHYTGVDEFYDGSQGGADAANNPTPAMISSSINNGVSIINYTGHGSSTNWTTSGFSITDVNALTNDNKLPFIFSVSCVIGNFTSMTCFCESWLRAENANTGNPTGAIGIYGSSINQSWSSPMHAQDEFNRLLVNEDYATFGALCYNSSIAMMDNYGTDGENMFLTWHIFGDPSINVLPEDNPPPPGNIRIQYMTYSSAPISNSVSVNVRIYNSGNTDVNLADVTAKYYYTYEGSAQNELTQVYWAGILPSGRSITSKVNAVIEGNSTNRVYNLSFDSDAGILKPGEYVECQSRFNKMNWSNYNQSNDYSFGAVTSFQDWQKITGYISGFLKWGTAP